MGLTSEQRKWLPTHLVPGMFVGSIGQGRELRRPFLFQVPLLQTPTSHSDGQIHGQPEWNAPSHDGGRLGPLADLPTVEAAEYAGWVPDWAQVALALPDRRTPITESDRPAPSLEPVEARFLQAIVDEPDMPSGHYPKVASISNRKAQQIRKRLLAAKMLREERVNMSVRGGGSILLIPTELGLQALRAGRAAAPQTEGDTL